MAIKDSRNRPQILGYYLRNEIRTGGHRRYLELLNSLAKLGWDVTVLLGDTIDSSEFSFKTIPLKPVYKGRIPYSLKQMIRVKPTILKLKKGNWLTIAFGETNYLTIKLVKLLLKAKVVFAFRSNSYRAKLNQYEKYNGKLTLRNKIQLYKMKKIERSIVKLTDLLIFQTAFDRDDILQRTVPAANNTIIPNSVRESWFDPKYKGTNSSSSMKKIIYLGSYDERKGALFLLKAMKELSLQNKLVKLEMFGYGKQKASLLNYVDTNNLREIVNINDKLANPLSHLGDYDLMVVPSIYDSYPNVVLESLFAGTPVIASNNSGMKAILDYSQLLFATGDSHDIANKIDALLSSETYNKAKDLCIKRLEAHDFIWPKRFEDAIKEIL